MLDLRPVASPRLADPASDVDIAIVGAGAAGIAAARQCLASGLSCAVLEARPHVGGRCVTAAISGQPVDLGAHWLHAGSINPLVSLGLERGEPLRRADFASRLVVDGTIADDATMREHRAAFEAAGAAIDRAAKAERDSNIAAVLPDLGRWTQSVSAAFALISGRPLDEVSAKDFPAEEFGENWLAPGGYGAYLARLAEGIPVALGHAVETIDWSGLGVALHGPRGTVRAKAAIVTVPVALLADGAVRFTPELPEATREAIGAFRPGTYEHIVLDWPDSPFPEADRFVKVIGRSSSYGVMCRLEGSTIHLLEIDYATAEAHGRDGAAIAAFAHEWLSGELGREAVRGLKVPHVTNWIDDPWSRSAWAVAPPGRGEERSRLAEPVGERLWLVGEATSRRLWGTVGGAWEEGTAAAVAAAAASPWSRLPRPEAIHFRRAEP